MSVQICTHNIMYLHLLIVSIIITITALLYSTTQSTISSHIGRHTVEPLLMATPEQLNGHVLHTDSQKLWSGLNLHRLSQ